MPIVIVVSLAVILAAAALYGWGRDRIRTIRADRAELAAYAAQVAGSDPVAWAQATSQRERDRLAARERALSIAWRAGIDDQIAEVNAAFDALQARTRSAFTMIIDRAATGGDTRHLIALARISPAAALREVRRANAVPTAFSWHTGELPLVERPVRHPATLRPRRRRATLRRALDVAAPLLTQ